MKFRNLLLILFLLFSSILVSQNVAHIVKFHYAKFTGKDIYMLGYDLGIRKMCFNVSGGIGKGFDNQSINANQVDDNIAVQKVKASQTIFPAIEPPNTYLESCNSTYKVKQARLGFTVYLRRNDTLGRAPQTGLHFGVEAIYSQIVESQTITYKSEIDEMRYSYSGINHFNTFGAGTHVGWQFALIKQHLYLDFRAVIPFYFPFMDEPNLNSPFAGNKYELQTSIGWHFYKSPKEDQPKGDGNKVRNKI